MTGVPAGLPAQLGRAGYETLHQVAVSGINVGFQRFKARATEGVRTAPGLSVAGEVNTEDRLHRETTQRHRPELHAGFPGQQLPRCLALPLGQEEDAALTADPRMQRALGCTEPEFQLHPVTCVAPVPGQKKALEGLCCQTLIPRFICPGAVHGPRCGLSYHPFRPAALNAPSTAIMLKVNQ